MNIFDLHYVNRIMNASTYVVFLKVGKIIRENCLKRDPLMHQFENIYYGNPGFRNTRLTKMNLGINRNPISIISIVHIAYTPM